MKIQNNLDLRNVEKQSDYYNFIILLIAACKTKH